MKIKMFLAAVALMGSAGVAMAQNNDCNANISVASEAVKVGNFKDAYGPWKMVLENCPTLRYYLYRDGFAILKNFLETNKNNPEEYQKYFNELMDLHDTRIKYIPEFLAKGTKVLSTDAALGGKALDYIQYAPKMDPSQAYTWLKQSLDAEQSNSSANVMFYYLDMSSRKLRQDEKHKEQFINDYLLSAELADQAIAAETKENVKAGLQTVRTNMDGLFINSGAATCESLQEIYAPKVEESQNDIAALKDIIRIMAIMGCRESEAYLQASLYAYRIEPSVDAAIGCAASAFKKGDINGSVKFFDEAIELENDAVKKADIAYKAAVVLASDKRLGAARTYANKAISFNPNYGQPYILIASLYAGNYKWSDEPALNKCTFFVAIDKLQRAKAVDSSVTEEANRLINSYKAYTPEAKDLFMLGYKAGDNITVGGWIGETTTIR